MDADTPATESGSDDAVGMFENLLGKQYGEAPPPPAEKAPPVELSAPDELEGDEPKEEKEQADDELDEDTEPKVFKVKVDGETLEVPEAELIKGYSRQQDYTKKTMALAAREQQVEKAVAQERQQYMAQINQLSEALGQQLSNQPNWEELLENDPVEYLKQQHLYQQRHAAYQQADQARKQHEYQSQQQAAFAEQQRQAREQEQLLANLPAWADPAKASKEKALIAKTLTSLGRTPEQLGKLDHIDVIVARKAALYDQMVAKGKEATQKVAALPPRMQKPGAPRATDARTVDMQALRKSGRTEDAAKLFEKMF